MRKRGLEDVGMQRVGSQIERAYVSGESTMAGFDPGAPLLDVCLHENCKGGEEEALAVVDPVSGHQGGGLKVLYERGWYAIAGCSLGLVRSLEEKLVDDEIDDILGDVHDGTFEDCGGGGLPAFIAYVVRRDRRNRYYKPDSNRNPGTIDHPINECWDRIICFGILPALSHSTARRVTTA